MARHYPPSQWYWFIRNNRYIGITYWDENDYSDPTTSEREIRIVGRGSFTAVTVKPDSGDWQFDDQLRDEQVKGVLYKVLSECYDNAEPSEGNELKSRKFYNKWRQKLRQTKRYFGKNRRTSAGTIQPFDLR